MSARKDAFYGNRSKRPPRPAFNGKAIPQTLRDLPRWVGWHFKWDGGRGKWTKVLRDPNTDCRQNAKSNDPATWSDFGTACQAANAAYDRRPNSIDGLGFVFNGDGIFGLDIDGCRNPETGELSELAQTIVATFGTYSEISPSGMGIKLFGRGTLPEGKGRKVNLPDGQHELELYDRGRYFTVTGQTVDGTPTEVNECRTALAALMAEHFPAAQPDSPPKKKQSRRTATAKASAGQSLSDQQIIDYIRRKHSALWEGSTDGHGGDDSRADLALCNLIAFFAGPDRERIDGLFRQSGLMREKWNRTDYSGWTIDKALEGRTEYYGNRQERNGQSEPRASISSTTQSSDDAPKVGVEIILDFFRAHYKPIFRRKNRIVCKDGSELSRHDVCDSGPLAIIAKLSLASDAPTVQGKFVATDKLPTFFRKWAPFAWGEMYSKLPDEDHADLSIESAEMAAEEFRRLIREAMLSQVVLGEIITGGDSTGQTHTERRSVIDWCYRFAKCGPWRSIRSYKCWCKLRMSSGGELTLHVAVRPELFSQLKADKRLCDINANRFTARCERYGIGSVSREDRPHGLTAVVLDSALVADLIAGLAPEPDDTPDPSTVKREEPTAETFRQVVSANYPNVEEFGRF